MSERRPFALTAWLLLAITSTVVGTSNALLSKEAVLMKLPRLGSPVFEVYVAAGILSIIGSVGMVFWKTWGFILTCFATVVVLTIDLYIDARIHLVAASIVFIILAMLVKNSAHRFS